MSHSAQLATVASVRQVRLRYRDVIALDGIDLDIPAGRMVGLIGPDGQFVSAPADFVAGIPGATAKPTHSPEGVKLAVAKPTATNESNPPDGAGESEVPSSSEEPAEAPAQAAATTGMKGGKKVPA